ncbi:hypothetical protein SLH46_13090 [Draconibacterium sp. IB214405]|uniref:hypothetical protein n=1 Tax=Draconibacterium sp. IB214405 TaxID=3097352 RepID=UPI002A13691D|nr:hypothetical protein [Draconibacterium sp. IB214405]MDX8340127.1 hypothetical protein [Draconibacterium sp. IB214405]
MIVIADSGSSKTDWLFISPEKEFSINSPGINPFFQQSDEIFATLSSTFNNINKETVSEVFFYGAGCIKGKNDHVVSDALQKLFTQASVFVEDDMLGAARAVLGNSTGITCILGTGANSCLYNGTEIIDKVPTLGFILGDEGSGAYLGKLFINDYFKRAIPVDLKQKMESELHLELADVLNSVYRQEYPSRYLAKFSAFLGQNKNHIYVQNLIKRSFTDFFFKNIERYDNYKNHSVNFVGSIAYHYSDLLKEVAFNRQIEIGNIIEKPINGLKKFHSNL